MYHFGMKKSQNFLSHYGELFVFLLMENNSICDSTAKTNEVLNIIEESSILESDKTLIYSHIQCYTKGIENLFHKD